MRRDGGRPSPETATLLDTIRSAQTPVPLARMAIPASVLRPPRLIGRDRERGVLHRAWAQSRVFWLFGEAGIGKTRLLADFVAGEEFEAQCVSARPGDAAVPYASLGRLLRALLAARPALLQAAPRGELARVMPEIDATVSVALGRQLALLGAIEALLRAAALDGLAAVVIDDLHHADDASVEMLQGLLFADLPLHWGFAQRSAEGPEAAESLHAALAEAQSVEAIALAPLDAAQLAELIGSLGLEALDAAALAPMLARHTGGNPMYALETIKHLVIDGGTAAELPRPAGVGQLIERRLHRLAPQALELARIAAVAGVDFGVELAEAVLGTRALALADAWRELEAAQVLRGNAFAHDLVHEAALAGVPAPIAVHVHAAVAAFLESRAGEPARVAAHWIEAGRPKRAVAALHAAAQAARRAMRLREAAAFLGRAAQIEGDGGDTAAAFESWLGAIRTLWVVDFNAIDAAAIERLDALARSDRERGAAAVMRASWLQERGDIAGAKVAARKAIEFAERAGDEPTAAEARQRLAVLCDWDGDPAASLALLQPLLPWAAARAGTHDRAEYYCHLAAVLDNNDRGAEARAYHQLALDAARESEDWAGVVTELGNFAISWALAGHVPRALELLREALQLSAAHDEARGCSAGLSTEMFRSLRDSARYDEALRWIEIAPPVQGGLRAAVFHTHVACGWIHLGQHARAQREIDAAFEAGPLDWARAKALQARARVTLALGRRGAAAQLDEAMQIMRCQPGRGPLRDSIALDHALVLGPEAALATTREVIERAERAARPGAVLAGHVRATRFALDRGAVADALHHARSALAFGDEVVACDLYPAERWWHAWRAVREAGCTSDAAEVLGRALAWIDETTRLHVPEPFRDSFRRANAVNQQLLRAGGAS